MERKIEIYPMPMFPTLSVADVRTSMEWYADTLGFALVFAMPGTDGETVLAHLRWRKHADLLLVPDARGPQAARPKGLGSCAVLSCRANERRRHGRRPCGESSGADRRSSQPALEYTGDRRA